MSSTYSRICLSHAPALELDDSDASFEVPPLPHRAHPDCKIGLGRFSGGLVDIWLPIRYCDKDGWHEGRWYDVSWMSHFPKLTDTGWMVIK